MISAQRLATLILLALACSTTSVAQTEFTSINSGLWGGEIIAVEFTEQGAPLALLNNGIHKGDGFADGDPTDVQWRQVSDLWRPTQIVRALDGTLYATNGRVIQRSVDDGESWSNLVRSEVTHIAAISSDRVVWHDGSEHLHSYTPSASRHDSIADPPLELLFTGLDGSLWKVYRRSDFLRIIGEVRFSKDGSFNFDTLRWDTYPDRPYFYGLYPYNTDTIVMISNSGIQRTFDGGDLWEQDESWGFILTSQAEDSTILAWASDRRREYPMYRLTDFGFSIDSCDVGPPGTMPVEGGPNGNLIHSARNDALVTSNCDQEWQASSTGFESAWIHDMVEGTDGTIYAARFRENMFFSGFPPFSGFPVPTLTLYRSSNRGESWVQTTDSLTELLGTDAAGRLYARVDSIPPGAESRLTEPVSIVVRSDDRGDTWETVLRAPGFYTQYDGSELKPVPVDPVAFQSSDNGTMVVRFESEVVEENRCSLFYSVDSGRTFSCLQDLMDDTLNRIVDATLVGAGDLFVAAYRTESDTSSVDTVGMEFFYLDADSEMLSDAVFPGTSDSVRHVQVTSDGAGRLYGYARPDTAIHVSGDRGVSWEAYSLPEINPNLWWGTDIQAEEDGIVWLTAVPHDLLGPTRANRFDRDRLLVSTDGGETWSYADNQGNEFGAKIPVSVGDGVLFDSLQGVARVLPENDGGWEIETTALAWSVDYGEDWHLVDAPLEYSDVSAILRASDGTVYVGTERTGLFRVSDSLAGVEDRGARESERSIGVTLFPMPVRGVSEVVVALSQPGGVSVELYDAIGVKVKNVVGARGRGVWRGSVSAREVRPGSYFLRVQVGSESVVVPVVIW